MRLCLMIEGQENVTWQQWCDLADACEEAQLDALFRSDHYLSVSGRTERGSLDAWTTLAGLAARTERIKLGTMVSPTTFRHPSVLAKEAVTVDHISNGRAELGMGAGWNEAEHRAYGFEFPETSVRMKVLEEQIEIVHRSWQDETFDFAGSHYRVASLNALPKPVQQPHPNLIVGGAGNRRSASLAAQWADEYNTNFVSPAECRRRRGQVLEAWEAANRDPGSLTFSLMTGCVVGANDTELRARTRAVMGKSNESGSEIEWLKSLDDEWVVGTVDEAVDKLGVLAEAGVNRVMLQHLAHEDTDMVRLIGDEIAPKLAAGTS
jgi:F420-dependent oxidoreductase-like protein